MSRNRKAPSGRDTDEMFTAVHRDGVTEDERAAVDELAAAMRALPSVQDATLPQLTAPDIATLLRRAPLESRAQALRLLGLKLAPRNISQTLCRDVLRLMSQVHAQDVANAITTLTMPLTDAMSAATRERLPALPDDVSVGVPASVLRLAMWSRVGASVAGARVLLWASSQPWWLPDGWAAERMNGVLDAAVHVVELTQDADEDVIAANAADGPGDDVEPTLATVAAAHPEVVEGAVRGKLAGRAVPAFAGLAAVDDTQSRQSDARAVEAGEATVADAALLAGVIAAQRLATEAAAALEVVRGQVESGDLPDLVPAAAAVAELAGATGELPGLRDGAADRRAEANRRLAAVEQIAVLTGLRARPGASSAVAEQADVIVSMARRMLDAVEGGTDVNEVQRAALLGLVELLRLVGAGASSADPTKLAELGKVIEEGLPDGFAGVTFAVLTGQLELGVPNGAGVTTEGGRRGVVDQPGAGLPEPSAPAADTATKITGRNANLLPSDGDTGTGHQAAIGDDVTVPMSGPSAHAAEPAATQVLPRPRDEQHDPSGMPVTDAVAELLVERRFALAAQLAESAGWPHAFTSAARLAALADEVRGETGPCAVRLRDELASSGVEALAADEATLLLSVPALLQAALVTGATVAGSLLLDLTSRLDSDLGAVAEQVGRRAQQGYLVGNPLRSAGVTSSELEQAVAVASAVASEQSSRPHHLKSKRATDIGARWFTPEGLLGELLSLAAADDRSQVTRVTKRVRQLSAHGELAKEVDAQDRSLRGPVAKPLEAGRRADLISLASEALAGVSAWLEAVAALQAAASPRSQWAGEDLAAMRSAVLKRKDAVLARLLDKAHRMEAGGSVAAAAANSAYQILKDVFAGFAGDSVRASGTEPAPEAVLTGELAKTADVKLTDRGGLRLPGPVTPAQLLPLVGRSWREGFALLLDAERFDVATYLLRLVETGSAPVAARFGEPSGLPADARAQLDARVSAVRTELSRVREQQRVALLAARRESELSFDDNDALAAQMDAADPARRLDLAAVRAELDNVATQLPALREAAAAELRRRLSETEAVGSSSDDRARIGMLITDGRLATAEDLLYYLELGQPLPRDHARHDLEAFFPAVPDALGCGLSGADADAAAAGDIVGGCDVLSFERLSVDARTDAAAALREWRDARMLPTESRSRLDAERVLLPALRLLGYGIGPGTRVNASVAALPKGRDHRFVDVTGLQLAGAKAMVPAFGSALHERLRVLMCWGQPGAEVVMGHAAKNTAEDGLLVAYFGTMPANVRRDLAAAAVRHQAPVIVCDDAVLAYVAANAPQQLEVAMHVMLPFANIQPYLRAKRAAVPPEMFYGRSRERHAVIDPSGTQVIYGGRGLGKSALLRDTKAVFEREPGRVAVHRELSAVDIGAGGYGADAIWDALAQDLRDAGVLPTPKGRSAPKGGHEVVRAGVIEWLSADPARRLLILLDEADAFFDADAPRFLETNRLKDLGQLSGVPGAAGRVKVVFAGLHSVQRFAKVPNNMFQHLAQHPTVIGALAPQPAFNLVQRPLAAMGYLFDDEELISRILGFCSYQPFLLQMFCHRLVEAQHRRRRANGLTPVQPPYLIGRVDVEAVENEHDFAGDLMSTFRETLNLDQRYAVIANVLAYRSHRLGLRSEMSDAQLLAECVEWWPSGFAELDMDGFRAYLQEMFGLGMLAVSRDGYGWRLRSVNVARMLGPVEYVEQELLHAETHNVPHEVVARSARRVLADGRRAPLMAAQLADVLGDFGNQVRLVLGSPATGVDRVAETLRDMCADLPSRFELVPTRNRAQFESELVGGKTGRRRVVLDDVSGSGLSEQACIHALASALELVPAQAGVSRSAVIVAGVEQLPLWWAGLGQAGSSDGLGVVVLRRLDRAGLRLWAAEVSKFVSDDKQDTLWQVTGGWPVLVEEAARLADIHTSEDAALGKLAKQLADPAGAAAFLTQVGVCADSLAEEAFERMIQLVDELTVSLDDLVAAAEADGSPEDSRLLVDLLRALGVVETRPGGFGLDRVTVSCWPYRSAVAL